MRSEKSLYENNYLKYATDNINDKLKAKISDARTELAELGKTIDKIDRKNIREELNDIEKSTRLTSSQKEKLYNRLIEISNALGYEKKYTRTDFDDQGYCGLSDTEICMEILMTTTNQY